MATAKQFLAAGLDVKVVADIVSIELVDDVELCGDNQYKAQHGEEGHEVVTFPQTFQEIL